MYDKSTLRKCKLYIERMLYLTELFTKHVNTLRQINHR